jgi:hypothetical protein
MVFPIDNSDVHTEIPSPSVQQADTIAPSAGVDPAFAGRGLFMVYYAAIFERGPRRAGKDKDN